MKGKRLLVTGGAGFIGSHLVDRLAAEGPAEVIVVDDFSLGRESNLHNACELLGDRITIVKADAGDFEQLRLVIGNNPVDIFFDLAVVPLPASLVDPSGSSASNVAISLAACEAARLGLTQSLLRFSSSEVYGTASYVPIDEEHPFNRSTPYAASKLAGDQLVLSYVHTFGIDAIIIRPFNNYGPRQNDRTYAGILPIIARRVEAGLPIEIYGDGLQTRDLIFVTDTVRAVVTAARQIAELKGRTINVATGSETSVNDLVSLTLQACGVPEHPVIHLPSRAGDVRRHLASNALAAELLGFAPEIDLLNGLQRTMDFYRSEQS